MLRTLPPLVFLAAGLLIAAKKPVTIESLERSKPAGTGAVVWAPDGKSFAYQENKKIWLYDVAARRKKQLVALEDLEAAATKVPPPERFQWQNRRVSEQVVQWSPSGKELLISAGGDLFLFQIQAGGWVQLTATAQTEHDPKFSPDGREISFRRDHDLYVLGVESRKVARLTQDGSATLLNGELDWVYPEELDLGTAYWWAPDSRRIAYLQFDVSREPLFPQIDLREIVPKFEPERFPMPGQANADVHMGVVSAAGGSTRWADLGDPRDHLTARVKWLSDSKSLAVQRLNRIQNRLDLLLADADSGTARLLLREQDPYWINVSDDLRFIDKGKRFLWSSERDGFRHLYLYSIGGEVESQLTRGEWEVTEVAGIDEAAGLVYFVSSERSPLDRDLYRVKFNGQDRTRVTQQAGTHAISMSPDCVYYLDSFSSLTAPPGKTVYDTGAGEWSVFQQKDRKVSDEYEILPTEIVHVKASDGALLYARLIKPARFQPGQKYPALVEVYGGPGAQSVRNSWAGANWDQVLAHQGFVIWQLDNRGSAGRGHKWETAVFRNLGEKELQDQKDGIRYLISLGFVDAKRIGIYGWSYGGFMTLYSLLHAPEFFRAGIAGAPVTDWRNYDTIYTERYMGLPSENAEGYRRGAVVNFAGNLKAPLMLVHNFEDDNVHFQNTFRMAAALESSGKDFEMLVYPEHTHGVTGRPRKQMLEAITAFLVRHLK